MRGGGVAHKRAVAGGTEGPRGEGSVALRYEFSGERRVGPLTAGHRRLEE